MTDTGVPATYDDLRDRLQERMDEFAAGQRRIAQVLLNDPSGTAFRTITETANAAQVHESSVVRFATSLGLKGYPGLVELCRQRLAEEAQLVSRFGRAQQHADSSSLLAEAAEHDQQNLVQTYSRIDPDQWDAAVQLLADADRIHVMGLRKCLPVAQLMTYLLRLVRPGVHQVAPVAGALVDEFRQLNAGDVFAAISIHRYTADTVRAFHVAKSRGLTTIAFTDSAGSPLARIADVSFFVDCEGVTMLRSVTAFSSLVQTLATGVAIHNGTQSRDELLVDEQLLSEFSVYSE